MRCLNLVLLTLTLGAQLLLATPEMEVHLRYHGSSTLPNSFDETIYYRKPISYGGHVEFGLRLTQDSRDLLGGLDYKFHWLHQSCDYFSVQARLNHQNDLNATLNATAIMAVGTLHLPLFSVARLYAGVGWFRRWTLLRKTALIPTFRSSYSEHDFLAHFGLEVNWSHELRTLLSAGNFDDFLEYNLQHPYMQIENQFELLGDSAVLRAYFRYHLLLGFGRMDEWMAGVGFRIAMH